MKIGRVFALAAIAGGGFAAYQVKSKMDALKASYDQVIAFSGEKKEYHEFEGASIGIMFAGIEIDFTSATMIGDSATLTLYGEYCGIDIKVPAHWNVKVQGKEERAGVDNSVVYDGEDVTSKLLIIDYDIKYAGLQVREGNEEKEEAYEVEDAQADDPEAMPNPYGDLDVEEALDMDTEI